MSIRRRRQSTKRCVRQRSTRHWWPRTWRQASTGWMRPILTPSCLYAVRKSTASRGAARRARIPPGKPKSPGRPTVTDFTVDWEHQQVQCPQGKTSASWTERTDHTGAACLQVRFAQHDCGACQARPLCTQATHAARSLQLQPQAQFEALHATRAWYASEEGQHRYKRRAGIEGTLSQGVRRLGACVTLEPRGPLDRSFSPAADLPPVARRAVTYLYLLQKIFM